MTRRFAIPAALFVAVWLCLLPGTMTCSDSLWSIPTAVSLLDHGDANLDEYLPVLQARGFLRTLRARDHIYTIYPLGASIMAIPGVVLLRPIGAALRRVPSAWAWLERTEAERGGCPPVAGEPIVTLHSWTEHLIASAFVAATAIVIYWLAADEVSIWSAVALAVLSVFATPAWSSASRALWQHGPSMLLLALALLIQRRDGPLFWVGLLLGFAYVVRPTNLVPLAAAALWALLSRPRRMPAFLAGAAVVLVPFVLANLSTYGHPLPPYYRPGFYGANAFKGEALAGHLVSPGRGLFVYSPLFLLSLAGGAIKARSRSLTLLDLSLAGCLVTHWIVVSTTNGNWWGGGSYGPRLFTDIVPYLMYFLIPVFAWVESARGVRRMAVATAVAVTSLVSVAAHAQGALNPSTVAWNGYPSNIDQDPVRVWDWRRPQFLAGLTFEPAPLPPVNFGAVACVEPPGPPGMPAIVSNRGGTVILRWAPAAGGVAMYFLEIGDAPGSRNLGTRDIRDVLEPSFTAQRVPRGTYYVRARAKNRCGDGPPSPDLCVVVR